ncbi:hypothetical protein [Moritella sp.]|uniref:hypothetical protein n=1 Tax=Moritella sp. TaxID=78556 RepID=UPI0025D39669|nr:hypothetical protein [Moritella sp.]MCJ8351383.1 hypothetical protein [Moritella sp.]
MKFELLRKHPNIRLIEYALENKTFTVDQVCQELNITLREFGFVKQTLFTLTVYQRDKLTNSEATDWCLSNDAFFNYLQYKEFEHSLNNSKKSNLIAIIAICISTISLVITAVGTLKMCITS